MKRVSPIPHCVVFALSASLFPSVLHAEIGEVWLTFAREAPTNITVSWTSDPAGGSTVFFGKDETSLREITVPDSVTLHHVEIPFLGNEADWVYRVKTGESVSPLHQVKGFTGPELRIAVIGNAHADVSKWSDAAIRKDDVHLLATTGDNVAGLMSREIVGDAARTNIVPFRRMIANRRDLFATTPFMPVLGNHDRQIRDRGTKENPPTEPVYDVDATAYLSFFPLPAPGWNWKFDLPDYGLRLIGLDLNHIRDLGTLLQTSHSYKKDSKQFVWYDRISNEKEPGITLTLQNEKNDTMRNREEGAWRVLFRRGTAVITGFGHFAERAEEDGFPYFNTSVIGKGAVYKDARSKFLASRNNYILLRIPRGGGSVSVQLKDLDDGELLDSTSWQVRP